MHRYAPISAIPAYYPHIKVWTVRTWVKNRQKNGFSVCMRRISHNQILIDLDALDQWIDSHSA